MHFKVNFSVLCVNNLLVFLLELAKTVNSQQQFPNSGTPLLPSSKPPILYRTRDCHDIDVLLYSKTPPIIETTNNIRIGCFQFESYPGLREQFEKANLNIWDNKWSDMYDFSGNVKEHCGFLDEEITAATHMTRLCNNSFCFL